MANQNTAPLEPASDELHSGADVFASLMALKPVELGVTDFSLGGLDFATPTLTAPVAVAPLYVQDYVLGPLEISVPDCCVVSAPAWCVGRFHVVWDGGRPSHIPDDKKASLIADLVPQLSVLQSENHGLQLTQNNPKVMKFVRKLADNAGIDTSDTTLKRQIIRPAFKIWRPKP